MKKEILNPRKINKKNRLVRPILRIVIQHIFTVYGRRYRTKIIIPLSKVRKWFVIPQSTPRKCQDL